MRTQTRRAASIVLLGAALSVGALAALTISQLPREPLRLSDIRIQAADAVNRPDLLDRYGHLIRLSVSDEWNRKILSIDQFPKLAREAVLTAEDRRFFEHNGVDWQARAAALVSYVFGSSNRRGASTITEQVVKMLRPRSRNLWSKWLEGWEAMRLEQSASKEQILEFYLNQVPYSHQRRGLAQAARLYFDRSLSTLNESETLALVALIKSPARLDPLKNAKASSGSKDALSISVRRLAHELQKRGYLSSDQVETIFTSPLQLTASELSVEAPHFAGFVQQQVELLRQPQSDRPHSELTTTLHPEWQRLAQTLLNEALERETRFRIDNGAVILIDHQADEVLAWAVGQKTGAASLAFNAALVPRQPGSTLKPFLYTMALDDETLSWTAATPILDEPLDAAIGTGTHRFRNYSRGHYGWVPLRTALANSLNIPAVKLARAIGPERFHDKLEELGVSSLAKNGSFYGEGLALGSGEISLWEMIQAYAVLARAGVWRPIRVVTEKQDAALNGASDALSRRVFSAENSSLIGNILSDPVARQLEFGRGTAMEFPVQTAVKTGTSTDFRDAWVFAYNYRYVVGVWMGNLSSVPTDGLSGSSSPTLLARALMSGVLRGETTQPLYLSPRLRRLEICTSAHGERIQVADGSCSAHTELFAPGAETKFIQQLPVPQHSNKVFRISQPSSGLRIAVDPRIPRDHQVYRFKVEGMRAGHHLRWYLNDRVLAESTEPQLKWQLEKGTFRLRVVQLNHSDPDKKADLASEKTFVVR